MSQITDINEWTMKTLDLAEKGNYLDRLLDIYPAQLPPSRPLPPKIRQHIINLYNQRKYDELVILLIELKDLGYPFPVEHPYAALLRHLSKTKRYSVIRRNRKVINELASLLVSLGLNNIIRGVERPKDINRTLGATFKSWIQQNFNINPFRVVSDYNYLPKCPRTEICVYAGPDEKIAEYIRRVLRLKEPSERFFDRDVIAKVKDMHVIGEARFLSTPGGSQNRDLENTLRFVVKMEEISKSFPNVKGIALIDGVVWYHNPYIRQIKTTAKGNRVVMSAIFLKDFLLDLFNKIP